MQIRTATDLDHDLAVAAAKKGVSKSQYVSDVLRQHLAEDSPKVLRCLDGQGEQDDQEG